MHSYVLIVWEYLWSLIFVWWLEVRNTRTMSILNDTCLPLHSFLQHVYYHVIYFLLERVAESQSSPSYKPSPVVAQHDWIYHCLCRRPCKPNLSVISAALIEFGRSCLLAKTSNIDSRSSSWLNILWSSSRAWATRSLSFESTTKIRPWVSW